MAQSDTDKITQEWLREFDKLWRDQFNSNRGEGTKLVKYNNEFVNVHEFLKIKVEELQVANSTEEKPNE